MESNQNLILVFDIYVNDEYLRRAEFKQESIIIGSGETAHISIPDAGIRQLHAVCNIFESKVTIQDLGGGGISVNGDLINSSQALNSNDDIRIGELRLQLKIIDMGFESEETTALEDMEEPAIEKTDPALSEPMIVEEAPEAAEPVVAEEFEEEPKVATPAEETPTEPEAAPESESSSEKSAPVLFSEKRTYITEGGVTEDFFEGPEQKNEDPLHFVKQFDSVPGTDLLEVAQLLGDNIVNIQNFTPSKKGVTKGDEIGVRLHLAEQPVAWIPRLLAPINVIMYPFAQTTEELKNEFFDDEYFELFTWSGKQSVAHIPSGWTATILEDEKRTELTEQTHTLTQGQKIILQQGDKTFVAQMIKKQQKKYTGVFTMIDAGIIAIASSAAIFLIGFGALLVYLANLPKLEDPEDVEAIAEIFEGMLELEEMEEVEDANEDAGEGAKAKEEEGKVGKEDSKIEETKGDKIETKDTKEKAVDDFMSGMDFGSAADSGSAEGASAALDAMNGGLGGMLGAKGIQAGSGGLGAGGGGLGGGGSADGLGGMGAKGMGRGRSGRGRGGGSYGVKRKRGSLGRIGGTPTILGGLDKSLIDAVIRRNMSQIRYCYQRQLAKNPSLNGKIKVKFVIAKDGSVSKASIESSTMGSAGKPVSSCIVGRFKRFKFPKPNGGIVIVKYPFIFTGG